MNHTFSFLRCERCERQLTSDDSIREYIATGKCKRCLDRIGAMIQEQEREREGAS